MIDADLRTGIDAVLAFPELDQPCFVLVIKVYGKRVEHHLEARRHIVIEPCVTGSLLPGVGERGEETAAAVKGVSEGCCQVLHESAFLTLIHASDPADDLFPAEMTEEYAKQCDQK